SGFIHSILMCRAMNRSITNVLFGAFGKVQEQPAGLLEAAAKRTIRQCSIEEAAEILGTARSIVFVPGYGMAVSQAQHRVREVADVLKGKGAQVRYGIHAVAGRMPGHMNVLLAEANVPYDELYDMDQINSYFPETDVAVVVGANDVVNPAAKRTPGSPIYGMPILEVEKARVVVVCVLVVDAAGVLKGIFTERDLLNRVAGRGLDWAACKVADYMTAEPESLRADDRIVWALNLMAVGGYRHVPLTDAQGRATGVV